MIGAFTVQPDPKDPADILFSKSDNYSGEIPEDQSALQNDAQRTLDIVRSLISSDSGKFLWYYSQLLSLCQAGLVGANATPKQAQMALNNLKILFIEREGPSIKNKYLKLLGKYSFIFSLPILLLIAIFSYFDILSELKYFLFIWVGCMAGTWLSFGLRKIELKFEELNNLESDQLDPVIRLIFSGLITITFGIIFNLKIFTIDFSDVQVCLTNNIQFPLVFGIMSGISEKILSLKLYQKISGYYGNF